MIVQKTCLSIQYPVNTVVLNITLYYSLYVQGSIYTGGGLLGNSSTTPSQYPNLGIPILVTLIFCYKDCTSPLKLFLDEALP